MSVASIADVREVVAAVAASLRERGMTAEAAQLEEAAAYSGVGAEELLVMREALVVTRPVWEPLPEGEAARGALAAAKRLAIDRY